MNLPVGEIMARISIGATIYIPVSVGSGAFLGEALVTFDSIEGPVSGFIRADQVKTVGEKSGIAAKVEGIESDRLVVRLHGSFFTTTGIAHISPDSRLELAA